MPKNEKTSKKISKIASKGLKYPGSLSRTEIKKLAGSALTQTPDKKKTKAKKTAEKKKNPKHNKRRQRLSFLIRAIQPIV